jgi:uncharacterized protein
MASSRPQVTDSEPASRFEIRVGDDVAYLNYMRGDGLLYLTHTDVPSAFAGRGYGSVLAKHALESARAAGVRVVPWCSFVRKYIERHPEYKDLVTQG